MPGFAIFFPQVLQYLGRRPHVPNGGRYLPDAAWKSLTPAEKAATNAAKRKATKQGKQFSKQPKKVAEKTARYR